MAFFFVQTFLLLTATQKKEDGLLRNIIFLRREVARRRQRRGPRLFQPRARSEQRATVVITERLIADRTFQQPVVNWMQLRGRKLQMHRNDRCTADDLYFKVVHRGTHAISLQFTLHSEATKRNIWGSKL